jgi:hypothetical protein
VAAFFQPCSVSLKYKKPCLQTVTAVDFAYSSRSVKHARCWLCFLNPVRLQQGIGYAFIQIRSLAAKNHTKIISADKTRYTSSQITETELVSETSAFCLLLKRLTSWKNFNADYHIKLNSMAWSASKLYPPSDRRLLAKLVPTFCGYRLPRGQRDGSLRPYSRFSKLGNPQILH